MSVKSHQWPIIWKEFSKRLKEAEELGGNKPSWRTQKRWIQELVYRELNKSKGTP